MAAESTLTDGELQTGLDRPEYCEEQTSEDLVSICEAIIAQTKYHLWTLNPNTNTIRSAFVKFKADCGQGPRMALICNFKTNLHHTQAYTPSPMCVSPSHAVWCPQYIFVWSWWQLIAAVLFCWSTSQAISQFWLHASSVYLKEEQIRNMEMQLQALLSPSARLAQPQTDSLPQEKSSEQKIPDCKRDSLDYVARAATPGSLPSSLSISRDRITIRCSDPELLGYNPLQDGEARAALGKYPEALQPGLDAGTPDLPQSPTTNCLQQPNRTSLTDEAPQPDKETAVHAAAQPAHEMMTKVGASSQTAMPERSDQSSGASEPTAEDVVSQQVMKDRLHAKADASVRQQGSGTAVRPRSMLPGQRLYEASVLGRQRAAERQVPERRDPLN